MGVCETYILKLGIDTCLVWETVVLCVNYTYTILPRCKALGHFYLRVGWGVGWRQLLCSEYLFGNLLYTGSTVAAKSLPVCPTSVV